MIEYRNIFNNKTLNIFTDASVRNYNGETIGSPGFVAVIGEIMVDHKEIILRESTNNESELYAIYMAINYAISVRDTVEVINIFSDSQFAIFGLREWIINWLNNIKNDMLYTSSNNTVANQALFMNIVYTILYYDLKVSFYHNRGHFNSNQVQEFIQLFTKHNFLNDYIDKDIAYKIIYYNDKVDKNTKVLLKNTNDFPPKLEFMQYLARPDLDINHYKNLLNI